MEVNTKFIVEEKIPVIRRISGGGTVYHDAGNLNFSFITHSVTGRQVDFRKYTGPVINFLKSLGVEARFEGKNDLKVDGLKISGNAEHVQGNRVLHHGTLLFSTSLEMLRNSLRKDKSCYTSRAVQSNPASVINLNETMDYFKTVGEFRAEMIKFFLKNYVGTIPYELTKNEIIQAESLANSKYMTWEWNWAYGPEYTFYNSFITGRILHSCNLQVKDGIIVACAVEGSHMMNSISKILIGKRHMPNELSNLFRKENVFLTNEELFNFF
jgi:lipoate-protein ligase A